MACLHLLRSMMAWAWIDFSQNYEVNSSLNTRFHKITLTQDPDRSFQQKRNQIAEFCFLEMKLAFRF